MFDQKEIDAYRKISAPNDLRDKILSSCTGSAPKKRNPHQYTKWISSVAACFVLVAVLTVFGVQNFGSVSVEVKDAELPKERSVVYDVTDVRTVPATYGYSGTNVATTVAMTIDAHAELSVSDGSMNIVETKTGDILYTGTDLSIDGETLVHWTVCATDDTHTFEMTVRGVFKTEKIILTYHVSENEWTLIRFDVE